MKKLLLILLLPLATAAQNPSTNPSPMETTTFIVIRHAEREDASSDPELSSAGRIRAEELKRALENVPVAAIYTTPYNRTRQTVAPLAQAKNIKPNEYSTRIPYNELLSEIEKAHAGKVIVIAGHSNTIPGMVKALSNDTFDVTVGEQQFDNLFIITRPKNEKPVVLQLHYGQSTP